MTTKMHQRISSVLAGVAIVVLLAVIVVVWVQVDHGAFGPKNNGRVEANVTERLDKDVRRANSHLDDLGEMEFVKPIKIGPPPLHDHDIIFDQLHRENDDQQQQQQPVMRHHSGHFRHTAAEVWDPHPRYEIRAFGRVLVLELSFNYKFVSPKLHLTHVWENYTRRTQHDGRTSGCFYAGKVRGEKSSDVAVSLCNGMTGYIRTTDGNYYIEPVEKFHNDSVATSILHRIKKLTHKSDDATTPTTELCEVHDNATIVDDDLLFGVEEYRHFVRRRDLHDELASTSPRHGNQEFHIETLIVADKSMTEYHSTDEDLNHYILTLMSHVALLFKHATVGNPISLAVVEIVTLKEIEFTSNTSDEKLKKFCNWQAKHAEYTRQQYDTALLLTRESVCKNLTAQMCNTLGVAEVGSMCNPTSSCAIVRDKGLSTSYTIAHELGHVLSMPHDDDDRCVKYNKGEKANIMSKVLQNDTKPWLWSSCSRHFLTNFLESSKSSCLLDEPNRDIITSQFVERLPGERFKVDRQCELEFGVGYKLCPYSEIAYCGSLWCTTDDMEGCKTQHMPWADGTKCGDYSWCHQGECIPYNRNLLDPIPGGWGEWMSWGPCSRSCGGGVKMSRRDCDSPPPTNGGAYCKGRNVRYASCNPLPCDPKQPDFRELQCAEFDGQTKGIVGLTGNVRWVPKYGMEHPDEYCKLYCRVKHSNSYYLLKEKVIDGTKCGLNTYDVCVNGICRHAGCDNRLDSTTTLDECGVCGGDNSKCEEIRGTYNMSLYGYNRVVRIPRGSSNVYISQRGYANTSADDNFLALVDGETGAYLLNGNFVVSQFVKDVIFAGMTISYSGSEKIVEHISTPRNRKLTKDLVLEVLSVGRLHPPDITYRYMIKNDRAPRYAWRVYEQQWTKCSSMCSGKKYLRPVCVELATEKRAHETHCSDLDMNNLVQQKDCNTHCRFLWNVVSRGPCSSQCGKGLRPVFHSCVKVEGEAKHGQPVDKKHCAILPKPAEAEPCQGLCWTYEEWSECSRSCGGGVQRRTAVCHGDNGTTTTLCGQQEKIVEQACNDHKCPTWSHDEWSPCSTTCGKGTKTRRSYCNVDGYIYNVSSCDPTQLGLYPVSFAEDNHVAVFHKECNERPCVYWTADAWDECNVTCGEGVQRRDVFCRVAVSTVGDEYCKGLLKPNATRSCRRPKCDDLEYKWITAAWSKCTRSCGSGTKSRMVVCRNKDGVENVRRCDQREVPVNVVTCNTHACPTWNFGAWGTCDAQCWQHRQVSCQNHFGQTVDDILCDLKMKPHKSTTCNSAAHCVRAVVTQDRRNYYTVDDDAVAVDRYKWKFEKWGRCSKSCGKGVKTRAVRCVDTANAVTVVDQFCARTKKPRVARDCEKNNCDYVWTEGTWGICSATCGFGFKNRSVACHRVLRGGLVDPNALPSFDARNTSYVDYCELHAKPSSRAKCLDRNCDDKFYWNAGPWSECSHSCGKRGRQTRDVHCYGEGGTRARPTACSKSLKPKRKRRCNKQMCLYDSCLEIKRHLRTNTNKDYYVSVRGRPALVYCYKMDTNEPEEFISLRFDQRNYAEVYDRSLNERDSCPSNGERRDDCDCLRLGSDRAGHTAFWKVRLNITTLQIVADDFTFSRQIYGKRIAYATAGDCYSERRGCVQGGFSVDLTDTSFRLSRNVRWIENGNSASSYVTRHEAITRGRCGGYCGSCLPEPNVGLVVEIT